MGKPADKWIFPHYLPKFPTIEHPRRKQRGIWTGNPKGLIPFSSFRWIDFNEIIHYS
jgi:hypothetical protein